VLEATTLAFQNPQEVDKYCFPDPELEFVHEIHNEHEKQTEAEYSQFSRKCVLKQCVR
jgi:hypothetical protein